MKTRILVSAVSLAIAVFVLPASAGLRIEGDPRAQSQPSPPSNYHEITFDDVGLTKAPAHSLESANKPANDLAKSKSSDSSPQYPATVVVQKPSTPVSPNPTAFSAYISQSGTAPASLDRVPGGTDVLLSQALGQIIPSDFRLQDNQVPLRKLATWTGNRSWVDVLADLGRAADFVSHINWDTREVSLAPAPASLMAKDTSQYKPFPPQVSQVKERHEIEVIDKPVSSTEAVHVVRTPAPPVVKSWTLDPSKTLRDNVDAWAKKAGWTLVWDAVDYPIFAPAEFQGEFSSNDGPLAQLFNGYRDSDQPLLVRLTSKDKVVYVRNRVLERAEVTGLPPAIPDGAF